MKLTSAFIILMILVLSGNPSATRADIVPVLNPSFEITYPLNTPCTIPLNCSFNQGPIPDWTITGSVQQGSWHPNSAFLNLPLPDGNIVAYTNGGSISQILSSTLTPDTTYTLCVDVGHRLDKSVAGYTISLFAGGTLLNSFSSSNGVISSGDFADETVSFTSGANVASGQKLEIVLTSAGQQIDFDNVRLTDSSAIPEPSSLSLLAGGLGLVSLVLRRR